MNFLLLIIILAVGFACGYGLMVFSTSQKDDLKTIGRGLGWTLISLSLLFTLFSFCNAMRQNCYDQTSREYSNDQPGEVQSETPYARKLTNPMPTPEAPIIEHSSVPTPDSSPQPMMDGLGAP